MIRIVQITFRNNSAGSFFDMKEGERPMDIIAGVTVFFIGMALVSSIVINICSQRLLEKCTFILCFTSFLIERERKHEKIEADEPISNEGTE